MGRARKRDERLELVVTEHGPAFRARGFRRLDPDVREVVEQVEWATATIAKAEAIRAECVAEAREAGVSWGVLALALGMSPQGARVKYGDAGTME